MTEHIEYTDDIERVKNALAGAASATGGTFLPDETAREIIEIVYEQNYLRGLIPALPQARQTMKIPKLTGSVSFHELTLTNVDFNRQHPNRQLPCSLRCGRIASSFTRRYRPQIGLC